MDLSKKRWRPSPLLVTVTTAAVVIAGTIIVGRLNARRYRVNARVEISAPLIGNQPPPSARDGGAALPDGEVTRLAVRVREVTGLVMGLTVLAAEGQIGNRRPGDVSSLVGLMAARNLLPPGVSRGASGGVVESDRAVIYVRYRPDPLGVEAVSVGREKLDGPAVIGRLTTGGDDDSGAVLLISKRSGGVTLPEAFAPLAGIVTADWQVEPLRDRSPSLPETDKLTEWVLQYVRTP